MNVVGGDSDEVLDVCQHFASNSGFVVKVQGTGINVYVVFRKRRRGTTHAGGGLVRGQEAYNTVQELSPPILEKLAHCQSYKVICFLYFCLQLSIL